MELIELCKKLEHFETPLWAVNAIIDKAELEGNVFDPCCGTGIMAEAAKNAGHMVASCDIHDWGYAPTFQADFLQWRKGTKDLLNDTVFMNPPFSKACEFVQHSFDLGAKKVIAFQRFAWWESEKRRDFWNKFKPVRVYICGNRADCWRHDIPHDQRGSSSPTAHAWFVWERDYTGPTELLHIWRKL